MSTGVLFTNRGYRHPPEQCLRRAHARMRRPPYRIGVEEGDHRGDQLLDLRHHAACGSGAVIDYVTKYCLASTVTTTCRGVDALRCVDLAVAEAQRLLNLSDLRGDRGVMDIIDAAGVIIGQARHRSPSSPTTDRATAAARSGPRSTVPIPYCAPSGPGSDPRRPTESSSGCSKP
jgi:hypothetical protein